MHILLVNDDGIHATGLRAMCEAAAAAGHRVSVCAPDRERSAAGHSATLGRPLHAWPVDFIPAARAWKADGTPADCARLGLYLVRDDPVDLVISGINRGMNMGGACVYSGTVGAAMEAAMCGTQALAVSLCVESWDKESDYGPAARLGVRVAEWAAAHPLPVGAIYSLNVPEGPYESLRGLVPARLAPVYLATPEYERGRDETGECFHFRSGVGQPMDDPDYDVLRVRDGYAVLTKLTWDFRLNADDAELGEIGL